MAKEETTWRVYLRDGSCHSVRAEGFTFDKNNDVLWFEAGNRRVAAYPIPALAALTEPGRVELIKKPISAGTA